MSIRTKVGISHLDVARIGVEMFYKFRQKNPDGRGDRYILMSFDDPPNNIKSAWKENYASFMTELRNLQTTGMSTFDKSLRRALELLNVNRAKSGVDNYAMGRFPFSLEPAVIICITDWTGIDVKQHSKQINLASHKIPGRELTIEPYRWDQKIYTFIVNIPPYEEPNEHFGQPPENAAKLCESTGGRALIVFSQRGLLQSLELLSQRYFGGINLNFQAISHGSEPQNELCDSNINFMFVPRVNNKFVEGNWPIPESFWLDKGLINLPPRNAFPILKFSVEQTNLPTWDDRIPVDVYELEASPLTRYLLLNARSDGCWPVSVPGSALNRRHLPPFGFLRTNASMTVVFLVIAPYNYLESFPFLNDFLSDYSRGITRTTDLLAYLHRVPCYYIPCFRRVLDKLGISFSTENFENFISSSLALSLRRIRSMAKAEFDETTAAIENRRKTEPIQPRMLTASKVESSQEYLDFYQIPPGKLCEELPKMRAKVMAILSGKSNTPDEESKHCKPISQMGNFQLYQSSTKSQILREVDPEPPRLHPFGNPFKLMSSLVDEADESMAGVIGEMKRAKRRSGPLPRNFRISVPYHSPSSSPSRSEEEVQEPVPEVCWKPEDEFVMRMEDCCERIRQTVDETSDVRDTLVVVEAMGEMTRDELVFVVSYVFEIANERENLELCAYARKLLNCL